MPNANYFPANSYGNAAAVYPQSPAGGPVLFEAGMTTSLANSNLPARAVRLYGAFRPGVIRANTILSAFPVLQGPHPRLVGLLNIQPSTTNTRTVPPYGNDGSGT